MWCGKKSEHKPYGAGLEEKSMEQFTSQLISTPRATHAVHLPLQRGPWNGGKDFRGAPFSTSVLHLDHLCSPLVKYTFHPEARRLRGHLHIKIPYAYPEVSLTLSQGTQKINPRNIKQHKKLVK